MTLGSVSASESSPAVSFCSCCGAKMVPYFSDDALLRKNQINQLISESFLTVKGAALFLPRGNSPTPSSTPRLSQRRNKHTGDLQKHLQTMFTVLRPEDTIRLAVRLESAFPQVTRYMVVVSTNGRQDTEESIVLGMDFVSSDSCCSVGLVLPLWSDTMIHLDGDGGFSVSTVNRVHVFKPVSVQAMWSALQSLHKACEVARCHNYYPGSLFLTWISYYQSRVSSSQTLINEWNAMKDVESHRAHSPVLFTDLPTERERTERLIKMRLREIMMQKDLENVTCKEIRTELEMQMGCNLREFKEFIDNEMIVILGQMDSPTEIFDHVFLGSEWNASNLEELQNSGVRYILNVTREIDNFFPGMFEYHNIRVYDEEATNLLEYWNDTYKFITKAKKAGAKCLVHCKMGISRSASTVIAYAMKEYGWDLDTAFDYVKDKRSVTKPNPSFMKQLEEYQGILLASKQRHNKLWRSHSDSDLSDRSDPSCKRPSRTLLRSDSHNNNSIPSSPSLHHFLGVAVLQALSADPQSASSPSSSDSSDGGESPSPEEELAHDPRPRAAAVVPEESRVAVTVTVPHPPPSVHVLPSAPKVQHAQLANSVPQHKLSLDLPESSSEDVSPLTLGSTDTDIQDLSDLTSEKVTPVSPAAPVVPLLSPSQSDDNNNPSPLHIEARGEADGSSTHSTDSIDFFSAREKFLGLAQEERPQKQTEQGPAPAALMSPVAEESKDTGDSEDGEPESRDSQSEDGAADSPPPQDNCVSVRHIVIEIEAISHPAPPLPPVTSSSSSLLLPIAPTLHLSSPDPQPPSEADPGSASPPATLQSASWPVGSVRRATEQLEQKLKQELLAASPRSPLHSPSGDHSLLRSLQPPDEPSPRPDSCDRCHTQEDCHQTGSKPDAQILDSHFPSTCRHVSVAESQTETSSLHTSAPSQRRPVIAQDEPREVTLDGATVKESDTDGDVGVSACGPDCDAHRRLVRGSQELARIQQTLQELQAFLSNQSQLPDRMDTDVCKDAHNYSSSDVRSKGEESALVSSGWQRVIELEARLRQAGLTPPSLMKRSASLAKLDCLDLNDLDLTLLHSKTHRHHLGADDSWKKKQRVLAHFSKLEKLPLSMNQTVNVNSASCCQTEEAAEGAELVHKQGRGHLVSSRRSRKVCAEKKHRAVAALYNTM